MAGTEEEVGSAEEQPASNRFRVDNNGEGPLFILKSGLIPRPFGSETNMFASQTPFDTSGLCPGVIHFL